MTLLQLNKVSLRFPGAEKPALSDIHYSINSGDFIIVLGSNGSGKSSLLKLLHRSHRADDGEIFLAGQALEAIAEKKFNHRIKLLNQNCHESLFPSLTVFENYLLVKQSRDKNARDFFANYILKFNKNLAGKLDQSVHALSGGEKQALALALTVLHPPEILLLDEHTSALDPHTANRLMELTHEMVMNLKITCLLTTHDLSIAQQYGNRILALRQGRVLQTIERSQNDMLTHQQLLAVCY